MADRSPLIRQRGHLRHQIFTALIADDGAVFDLPVDEQPIARLAVKYAPADNIPFAFLCAAASKFFV